MIDKEQTEEMYFDLIQKRADYDIETKGGCEDFALELIGKGWRKILEGSVILTKTQYDELKGRAEEVFNEMRERMVAEVNIERLMGEVRMRSKCKAIIQEFIRRLTIDRQSLTVEDSEGNSVDNAFIIPESTLYQIAEQLYSEMEENINEQ